jgi:large subunit ribosomal protein L29
MNTVELRDLTERELVAQIKTARRDLLGLRFQHATGELDNTAGLRRAKKDIARALTVAPERGIETNG